MSGQPKLLRLAWQFRRQWLLVRRRLLLYKTKSRIISIIFIIVL